MSEDKLRRDMVRAAHARQLLDSELLQETFATLERQYIEAWRATTARDTDARERLWQAVNVVGKIKDHLGHVLDNGKLAARELEDMQPKQRTK